MRNAAIRFLYFFLVAAFSFSSFGGVAYIRIYSDPAYSPSWNGTKQNDCAGNTGSFGTVNSVNGFYEGTIDDSYFDQSGVSQIALKWNSYGAIPLGADGQEWQCVQKGGEANWYYGGFQTCWLNLTNCNYDEAPRVCFISVDGDVTKQLLSPGECMYVTAEYDCGTKPVATMGIIAPDGVFMADTNGDWSFISTNVFLNSFSNVPASSNRNGGFTATNTPGRDVTDLATPLDWSGSTNDTQAGFGLLHGDLQGLASLLSSNNFGGGGVGSNYISLSNYFAFTNNIEGTGMTSGEMSNLMYSAGRRVFDFPTVFGQVEDIFDTNLFSGVSIADVSNSIGGVIGAIPDLALAEDSGEPSVVIPVGNLLPGQTLNFEVSFHHPLLKPLFDWARQMIGWIACVVYAWSVFQTLRKTFHELCLIHGPTVPNVQVEGEAFTFGFGGNFGVVLLPLIMVSMLGVLSALMAFTCAEFSGLIGGGSILETISTFVTNPSTVSVMGWRIFCTVVPVSFLIDLGIARCMTELGAISVQLAGGALMRSIPHS